MDSDLHRSDVAAAEAERDSVLQELNKAQEAHKQAVVRMENQLRERDQMAENLQVRAFNPLSTLLLTLYTERDCT